MKLVAALFLLAFVSDPVSDRLRTYPGADSYWVKSDIFATPHYRGEHVLCEVSLERRHYSPSRNNVDMEAAMSREVILSLFDQLSPPAERGWAGWGKPGQMEFTEGDGGMVTTHVPYQYVSLVMFGKKVEVKGSEQKYVAAIIRWQRPECVTR